jgi:hypothetical protein
MDFIKREEKGEPNWTYKSPRIFAELRALMVCSEHIWDIRDHVTQQEQS